MATATLAFAVDASVKAEDAPLGVQLWPTYSPDDARHFTLEEVRIVRRETGTVVCWVYQDGKTRWFDLGVEVVVRIVEEVG